MARSAIANLLAAFYAPPEPILATFSQFRVEAIMEHVREHRSLLASPEKHLLIAIAGRLPRWLSSDHLSLLGPSR